MTLHPRGVGSPLQRVLTAHKTGDHKDLKPVTDIVDLGDVQIVYMELPGADSENVSIDLEGTKLTITSKVSYAADYPPISSTSSTAEAKATLSTTERRFGLYKRILDAPAGLKEHEIEASMENGVLRLEMQKETAKETK